VPNKAPLEVLQTIITENCIRASSRAIKGAARVVCFCEAPLWAMRAAYSAAKYDPLTFQFNEPVHGRCLGYQPYGLLFDKRTAYRFGARPVLYMSAVESSGMPASIRWRIGEFCAPGQPAATDFSHEREWRCLGDVDLNALPSDAEVRIVVWTPDDRDTLLAGHPESNLAKAEVIVLSTLDDDRLA
jgi:hypothetical protein